VLSRLALLFIVVPIVELALLIQMGSWVGVWPTLGLVVFTGIAGAWLARAEGLRTLSAFQEEMGQGRLPGQSLLDGVSVLVGAAFLLTPGLLTDVAGFSLLLPPSRRWLQKQVRSWLQRRIDSGQIQVQVWTPWAGTTPPGPGRDPASPPGPGPGPGPEEGLDPEKEIRQGSEDRGS
jgi:UPF0716 protein FxsA